MENGTTKEKNGEVNNSDFKNVEKINGDHKNDEFENGHENGDYKNGHSAIYDYNMRYIISFVELSKENKSLRAVSICFQFSLFLFGRSKVVLHDYTRTREEKCVAHHSLFHSSYQCKHKQNQ